MAVKYKTRNDVKGYIYKNNYPSIEKAVGSVGVTRVMFYKIMTGQLKSFDYEAKLETLFRCSIANLKRAWNNTGSTK